MTNSKNQTEQKSDSKGPTPSVNKQILMSKESFKEWQESFQDIEDSIAKVYNRKPVKLF